MTLCPPQHLQIGGKEFIPTKALEMQKQQNYNGAPFPYLGGAYEGEKEAVAVVTDREGECAGREGQGVSEGGRWREEEVTPQARSAVGREMERGAGHAPGEVYRQGPPIPTQSAFYPLPVSPPPALR